MPPLQPVAQTDTVGPASTSLPNSSQPPNPPPIPAIIDTSIPCSICRTTIAHGNTDICNICYEPFSTRCLLHPCHHIFDYECISSWLTTLFEAPDWTPAKTTCPLCRGVIGTIERTEPIASVAVDELSRRAGARIAGGRREGMDIDRGDRERYLADMYYRRREAANNAPTPPLRRRRQGMGYPHDDIFDMSEDEEENGGRRADWVSGAVQESPEDNFADVLEDVQDFDLAFVLEREVRGVDQRDNVGLGIDLAPDGTGMDRILSVIEALVSALRNNAPDTQATSATAVAAPPIPTVATPNVPPSTDNPAPNHQQIPRRLVPPPPTQTVAAEPSTSTTIENLLGIEFIPRGPDQSPHILLTSALAGPSTSSIADNTTRIELIPRGPGRAPHILLTPITSSISSTTNNTPGLQPIPPTPSHSPHTQTIVSRPSASSATSNTPNTLLIPHHPEPPPQSQRIPLRPPITSRAKTPKPHRTYPSTRFPNIPPTTAGPSRPRPRAPPRAYMPSLASSRSDSDKADREAADHGVFRARSKRSRTRHREMREWVGRNADFA